MQKEGKNFLLVDSGFTTQARDENNVTHKTTNKVTSLLLVATKRVYCVKRKSP